jgi:redox-sensitive bicupin YhaK (pirin superfamily)
LKINIHRSDSRGSSNLGWLTSHHTYSFSSYQNPERMGFGALRVINDDVVQPEMGFGMHAHENMEIISIPLTGSLQHKDSMGNQHVIEAGEVQIMSAGTGITHSEYNHSTTHAVSFLQIWVLPKKLDIEPRYEQKRFDVTQRKNKFQIIASPNGMQGSLSINQDAYFSVIEFTEDLSKDYELYREGNGVYLFVITGSVNVDGTCLTERDGVEVTEISNLQLKGQKGAQLLCMEIPL